MMRCLLASLLFLTLSSAWFFSDSSLAAGGHDAEGGQPAIYAIHSPDTPDRQGEVQMETGLALPLGDLGAGYKHTRRGMGAEQGYHMGLRVRFYPLRSLVLAPSFTYIEFGDHEGLNPGGDKIAIRASIVRYGLDLLYVKPSEAGRLRPFVGFGMAIARNKYHEELPAAKTEYLASINSLAGSAVFGVRHGDWDASFVYEINPFRTSKLSFEGEPLRYHWNSLLFRVSYTLPRF